MSTKKSQKKISILLVEDNENDARAVESILEDSYTIHLAHDSAEACRLLYLIPVDLILLDINLGDKSLSGFQLIDYLRMQDRFNELKIVAITGRSRELMEIHSSFIKFDDYVYKPFTKDMVVDTIERVMMKKTSV